MISLLLAMMTEPAMATTWEHNVTKNEVANTHREIARGINRGTTEAVLLRCNPDGGLEIFISVGGYHNTGTTNVSFRFSAMEAPISGEWQMSTNGQIVFLPVHLTPSFITLLKEDSKLYVSVSDYQGSQTTAAFSLNGSTAAINKLSCLQ